MTNDSLGRTIKGDELTHFKGLSLNGRLKWVREEMNRLYVGQYTVKKVAKGSGAISHQGLYNLEGTSDKTPKESTIQGLADYYQVPVEIFSAAEPKEFFLGKQYKQVITDIREASYEVEIHFRVKTPANATSIEERLPTFKARAMDYEELLIRLRQEVNLIERRLIKQRKVDEAFDFLSRRATPND